MKARYAKSVWVLFDLSNSNERARNYLWWFETRALARAHRTAQHAMQHGARLSQPVKLYHWV